MHRSTLKLLIIDDDPADREAYKRYLGQDVLHKYEFLESETLEDGLRTLLSEQPDCLLLDYQLPDGTGLELLEQLQEEAEHVPTPVVMLTGQGNHAIEAAVVQAGVQDYLVKDGFDSQALIRVVWYAIERHRMVEKLHRAKQEAQRLATHCSLTNLPNRYLVSDRLSTALSAAKRNGNRLAVLFLDLDRFKPINDTLGHDAGDQVLKVVAERLLARLRAADTAARLGGDEFIIILTTLTETIGAARVAQSLLCILSEVIVVDGHEVYVSASIGIALYPNDGDTTESLLCSADAAMYRAKGLGGNSYQFYTKDCTARL